MKATIVKDVNWKETLRNMTAGSYLIIGYKQESYMRQLSKQLRDEGYLFKVARVADGIKVSCDQSPKG